jgi:hypothetical protein
MITWQQVVDQSVISGDPAVNSFGQAFPFDSFTFAETSDWFGGEIIKAESYLETEFEFILEDFDDIVIDGDTAFYTFVWKYRGLTSNGSATDVFYTLGATLDEAVGLSVGEVDFSTRDPAFNPNWSRSEVALQSWEEVILENLTGITSTVVQADESIRTTTVSAGQTTTTNTIQQVARTTTTLATDSTSRTWSATGYTAQFVTGQTTAKVYSEFLNEIPAVLQEGSIVTAASTIEPLSFYEIDGRAARQDLTVQILTSADEAHNRTSTSEGAIVTAHLSSNPQTTIGGTKATITDNGSFRVQNTQQQNAADQFATILKQTRLSTTKEISFIGDTVAAPFVSTSNISVTSEGYLTNNEGFTISGAAGLTAVNAFATTRPASVVAVAEITVGVRANSSETAGGGVEAAGQGNVFFAHTTSVLLPASTVRTDPTKTTTFSLNSYTERDSNGGETVDEYAATGVAQSQYMTIATTQSSVARATVLGGAIRGEAIIFNGKYSTFAGIEESTIDVSEPFATSWQASAATSAWIPALRVETVGASAAVVAISRHSFTEVLDD